MQLSHLWYLASIIQKNVGHCGCHCTGCRDKFWAPDKPGTTEILLWSTLLLGYVWVAPYSKWLLVGSAFEAPSVLVCRGDFKTRGSLGAHFGLSTCHGR